MKTEDLFKYGVTPKDGENAGKRFRVLKIEPTGVYVNDWDDDNKGFYLANGAYDLWRPPKTLFEDTSIVCTLGNLWKAISAEGLDEKTKIKVGVPGFFLGGAIQDASAKVIEVDGKKAILFY